MTQSVARVAGRAAELRREFDRSFAVALSAEPTVMQDLLAVRLGGQCFALRLSEIAGLFADKKITRVPGANTALLGIAGFRGVIAPVYDLQSLLGLFGGKAARWLVIAAAAPVAFALEAFDGRFRVSSAAITPREGDAQRGFTKSFVLAGGVLRPVVELSHVLDAIKT